MTFSRTEDRDKTISVTGSRDLDDDGSASQVLAVPTLDRLSYKVRIAYIGKWFPLATITCTAPGNSAFHRR
jgi:hypothetical protein